MILLDTHAWLWLCLEPRRLSAPAGAAIRRAVNGGGLAIASITLWEVAMMLARGRVIPHGTPEAWLPPWRRTCPRTSRATPPADSSPPPPAPKASPS